MSIQWVTVAEGAPWDIALRAQEIGNQYNPGDYGQINIHLRVPAAQDWANTLQAALEAAGVWLTQAVEAVGNMIRVHFQVPPQHTLTTSTVSTAALPSGPLIVAGIFAAATFLFALATFISALRGVPLIDIDGGAGLGLMLVGLAGVALVALLLTRR